MHGVLVSFCHEYKLPREQNKLAPEQIQEEGRNGGRVERRGAWCSQIRSNFHRDVLGELAKSSLIWGWKSCSLVGFQIAKTLLWEGLRVLFCVDTEGSKFSLSKARAGSRTADRFAKTLAEHELAMCMQDSGLPVLPLSATVPTVGPGHAEVLFRPGAVDDSLEAVLNLDSRWGLPGPRSGGESCPTLNTHSGKRRTRERFASEIGISLSRASLIKHMASGWFQSILANDSEYGFCSDIVHFQPSATHAMFVTLVASAVPFVTVAPKKGHLRLHFASETFYQKILLIVKVWDP